MIGGNSNLGCCFCNDRCLGVGVLFLNSKEKDYGNWIFGLGIGVVCMGFDKEYLLYVLADEV